MSFDCSLELLCSVVCLDDAKDLFSKFFESLLDLTDETLSTSVVAWDISEELKHYINKTDLSQKNYFETLVIVDLSIIADFLFAILVIP